MNTMGERGQEQEAVLFDKQQLVADALFHMSYHELEAFMKEVRRVKLAKYPSYGKKHRAVSPRLRKGFADTQQLIRFFTTMPECTSKKLLLRQFFYALRVGEVCTATYNHLTGLVRIETEKEGGTRIDYLPFIDGTESLFECPNMSKDCLRNYFHRHCKRLGPPYHDTYYRTGNGWDLNRLSTHSLRVTAGNLLREHTHDPFKQKAYLRHSMNSTYGALSCYMEYTEQQMRKDLNATFHTLVKELL